MQVFSSQNSKLIDRMVWIIMMFLWAVWTLILTAPIHCRASIAETVNKWCNATFLQIYSDEETN